MIVFLTFWQALFLPLAPLPGSSVRWEDLVLSVEMVIFAILMNIAFSWNEFQSGLKAGIDIPTFHLEETYSYGGNTSPQTNGAVPQPSVVGSTTPGAIASEPKQ